MPVNRNIPKEYNTLKSELQELNMNYMKKKKEKEDSTGKNDSKEQMITSNKKVDVRKKLHVTDDFRARSSTLEDVGTIKKEHNQLCLRSKEQGSRTFDMNELRGIRKFECPLQSPMNSPLAVRRKLEKHLFEKRPSLPCNSLPSSLTNSPRFSRRNSEFIAASKQAGLSAEDVRRLSGSFSELEMAKPRPKPYEEKPFYLCPENGSFRCNYWKSESVALEKRITEAQKRRVSRVEEEKVQEERPLAEILPPVKLSSIYAQENNKTKRKEAEKESKRKTRGGRRKGSNEKISVDISLLTKNLSDCRYLRMPKNS